MSKFFTIEPGIENKLKKICDQEYVLHGTPHKYEQDTHNGGHVFIPKNHVILANKSPIHAIYHALFDEKKSKLNTYTYKNHTYASVILNNPEDALREKGYVYIFSQKNFIKLGMLYKKDPNKALLDTLMVIDVKLEDFRPPIYYNFKILKEKTF
ncbi:MAG: hypothetical protein QXL18_00235 [Candidatus Woesearchaeota archaeon]